MSTLRDADRVLAHSLSDELPEPYAWEPYTFHWTHVLKFAVGIVLTYGLIVALAILGAAAQMRGAA